MAEDGSFTYSALFKREELELAPWYLRYTRQVLIASAVIYLIIGVVTGVLMGWSWGLVTHSTVHEASYDITAIIPVLFLIVGAIGILAVSTEQIRAYTFYFVGVLMMVVLGLGLWALTGNILFISGSLFHIKVDHGSTSLTNPFMWEDHPYWIFIAVYAISLPLQVLVMISALYSRKAQMRFDRPVYNRRVVLLTLAIITFVLMTASLLMGFNQILLPNSSDSIGQTTVTDEFNQFADEWKRTSESEFSDITMELSTSSSASSEYDLTSSNKTTYVVPSWYQPYVQSYDSLYYYVDNVPSTNTFDPMDPASLALSLTIVDDGVISQVDLDFDLTALNILPNITEAYCESNYNGNYVNGTCYTLLQLSALCLKIKSLGKNNTWTLDTSTNNSGGCFPGDPPGFISGFANPNTVGSWRPEIYENYANGWIHNVSRIQYQVVVMSSEDPIIRALNTAADAADANRGVVDFGIPQIEITRRAYIFFGTAAGLGILFIIWMIIYAFTYRARERIYTESVFSL